MDTSVVPHKLIGHILVEKSDDFEIIEFDLGKFNEIIIMCL